MIGFLAVVLLSFLLVPFLGRNFFPSVDAGQIAMHVRAPVGTRIEETLDRVRSDRREDPQIIPPDEIASIADNIGLPVSAASTRPTTIRARSARRTATS
jgi:multidrug efflux pump subunit AcrB